MFEAQIIRITTKSWTILPPPFVSEEKKSKRNTVSECVWIPDWHATITSPTVLYVTSETCQASFQKRWNILRRKLSDENFEKQPP